MPVGHSPPIARSRSLNTLDCLQRINPSSDALVTKNSAQPDVSLSLTGNMQNRESKDFLEQPLSWKDDCVTPTSCTTSTTTTSTFVQSMTRATTTTTATLSTFPMFSTISTPQVQVSSSPQPQMATPLNNGSVQTQSKRNRTSPNSHNSGGSSKKMKTKQVSQAQSQKTLADYWLSKPEQSNRFAALAIDDDIDENNQEAESKKNSNTNPKVTTRKPPPIYVQGVQVITNLNKALNNIPNCKYELKVLKDNEVKVQPAESIHYTQIIKLLKEKNTQYYTYKPKEDRGFRVFLRNMHYSADTDELKQELCELGHEVTHIQNVLQLGTKKPLSLFSIELKTKDNNKEIYHINTLQHCKVKFEPPRQKRTIPQCTNCQAYGHTKNFCTKTSICVKCAQQHKTVDCPIKQKSEHVKCALCGDKHPASYKGCMVYKKLRVNKFPPLRNKQNERETGERGQQQPLHNQKDSKVNPSISYAQAATMQQVKPTQVLSSIRVASTQEAVVSSEVPVTKPDDQKSNDIQIAQNSNNDMQDLKDMVKQLMTQMSNMMSIITTLLTKLNG